MLTMRQIESARSAAAYATFKVRLGEAFGPFDSEGNRELIVNNVVSTWGNQALQSADSYEISFQQLVAEGKVTKNESYVPPSVRREIETMSGSEAHRRYLRDSEFRKHFDNAAAEDAAAGRMSDSDPYKHLTAASYYAIEPVKRAQLFARDAFLQGSHKPFNQCRSDIGGLK